MTSLLNVGLVSLPGGELLVVNIRGRKNMAPMTMITATKETLFMTLFIIDGLLFSVIV
jgi:hypothetical protein